MGSSRAYQPTARLLTRLAGDGERHEVMDGGPVIGLGGELDSAVMESLGSASACWENLSGAGVFESDRCAAIGDRLLELLAAREASKADADAEAQEAHDAEARRREVIALGQLPTNDPSVQAGLLTALGDVDWRVRKEAASLLGQRVGSPELFETLVDAVVQGENVGLRNSALEALSKHGFAVADPLLARLPLVDQAAKKVIFEGLGNSGSTKAVPALVEAVRAPDANTSAAAVDALSRIGGHEAELALRGLLRSEDPFQRLAHTLLEPAIGLHQVASSRGQFSLSAARAAHRRFHQRIAEVVEHLRLVRV